MIKDWALTALGALSLVGTSTGGLPPRDMHDGQDNHHPMVGIMEGRGHDGAATDQEGHRGAMLGPGEHRMGSSTKTVVDPACVGAAVAARETALGAGITTYNTDIGSAYSSRASALASAYALTDKTSIMAAVKTAWAQFGAGLKLSHRNWVTVRTNAWTAFRTAARACGATSAAISDSQNSYTENAVAGGNQ